MLLKFIFCSIALVEGPDVHSLEIETFLHSGSSDRNDPTGVVVYSDPKLNLNNYVSVLEAEKNAQMYRFLSEMDIREVRFSPAGKLRLQRYPQVTEESVVISVSYLQEALGDLKKERPEDTVPMLSDSQAEEKITRILNLPTEPQKVNAVRHLAELTFLLDRYDAVEHRLLHPNDLDGYTNYEKTPNGEMAAVSNTLFGKVVFLRNFDLKNIDLDRLHDIQLKDRERVPMTLTVPYKSASTVLEQVTATVGFRLDGPRTRFSMLKERYKSQFKRYAAFNDIPQGAILDMIKKATDADGGNANFNAVESVRKLRILALYEYEKFKFPFRDIHGEKLFDIFVHDPEIRSVYMRLPPGAEPFSKRINAVRFLEKQILPSFNQVPKPFYAGRLQSVLLSQKPEVAPNGELLYGMVRDAGREMILVDHGRPLIATLRTIRHECGHVLDHKLGTTIRSNFQGVWNDAIDSSLQDIKFPFPELIQQTYNVFQESFPHDGKKLRLSVNILRKIALIYKDRRIDIEEIDINAYEQLKDKIKDTLTSDDVKAIIAEVGDMMGQRAEYDLQRKRLPFTTVDTRELPGLISYYAASADPNEDVAEISRHMASDAYRAATIARASDSTIRQKLELWLQEFGKNELSNGETESMMRERIDLATKWKRELADYKSSAEPPISVFTYTKEGAETVDVITQTERFVSQRISEGRTVAWLHVYESAPGDGSLRTTSIGRVAMLANSGLDPEIHLFGAPDEGFPHLKREIVSALTSANVNAFGQTFDRREGRRLANLKDSIVHLAGNCVIQHLG